MTSATVEKLFKFIFFLAVIFLALVVIAAFILIVKISLLFMPEINAFGMRVTNI